MLNCDRFIAILETIKLCTKKSSGSFQNVIFKIRGAHDKFPDFFRMGIQNCRRLLKIQYLIAIHLTNFYDFKFKSTVTAAIGIHPSKAWLSQLVNFKNAICAHRDLHHWRLNPQPQYAETETLPLGHRFMPHISEAELTSRRFDPQWWRSRWDLIRSKQLFNALYVACRCLPDFLVMVISYIIYQFFHSKLYNYISCPWGLCYEDS